MQRIRLKNPKGLEKPICDVIEILETSERSYQQMTIGNLWFSKIHEYGRVPSHVNLKSIKLITCTFDTEVEVVRLLTSFSSDTLEDIEFSKVKVTKPSLEIPSICVPQLKRFKTDTSDFRVNFTCSALKVLEVINNGYNCDSERILSLMRRNPQIQELTIFRGYLQKLFVRSFENQRIFLNLKKLKLVYGSFSYLEIKENFEAFLMSQRNSLEEIDLEDLILDTCMDRLLREFRNLRKLVVNLNEDYLKKEEELRMPLQLPTNLSITELRLRIDGSKSQMISRKLIIACPNVKRLFTIEMTQPMLEICSVELPNLETIYALSLIVNELPSPSVKFKKLRIRVYDCKITNKPEISRMKLSEKNAELTKLLS